jgi:hypothetical protein
VGSRPADAGSVCQRIMMMTSTNDCNGPNKKEDRQ